MGAEEFVHSRLGDQTLDGLVHYGIKGMRWGIRRERGADGTVGGRGKAPKPPTIRKGNPSAVYDKPGTRLRRGTRAARAIPPFDLGGLRYLGERRQIRRSLRGLTDKQINDYSNRITPTTKYAVVKSPRNEPKTFIEKLKAQDYNLSYVTPNVRRQVVREILNRNAKQIQDGMNTNPNQDREFVVKPATTRVDDPRTGAIYKVKAKKK